MELILLILIYMIPGLIAVIRNHNSKMAILALNIILGWTILGWIIAFIWSLTGTKREVHT